MLYIFKNKKDNCMENDKQYVCETRVWAFLWKYAKRAKYLVIGFLVLFIASAFLSRLQYFYSAEMIGVISNPEKYADIAATLVKYLSIIAVIFFSSSLIEFARRKMEALFVPFSILRVAKDLFVAVHKHSVRFFEEEMSGNISGKVHNILTSVENMYFHILFGLLLPIIEIVMSLAFIGYADKKLALLLGVLNLIFLTISIYFRKKVAHYAAMKARLSSEASGIFVDGVTNSHLVKSFANYFYEKRLYYQAAHKAADALSREMSKDVQTRWISQFLFDLLAILSYALIFYFWYKYHLSVADVVLTTSLNMSLVGAFRSMGYFAGSFAQIYGSIKDGLSLLNKPCEVVDAPGAKKLVIKTNHIVFDQIKFRYNQQKKLFDKFNLKIEANQKIGLVGRSGSGKSTLIKLLLRYYDVQGGQILIDGQNVAAVTQESLRKNIAVIPQESTLFNRTIMENIRYGNPKATDRQVINAAKKAYIHEFIMTLPQGYESKVGERGVMLSGGERQRIAIARAILKNAPILILDEATSALDSESERYIQKSLKELMKNKTVVAIAHRLSTLHEMDYIVVMEKGKIVEQGTQTDLLKQKGAYYNFYSLQSEGFLGNMD